jgi:hypothetical protein
MKKNLVANGLPFSPGPGAKTSPAEGSRSADVGSPTRPAGHSS